MLSYPKVNAAHKIGQESILDGEVVLEEKTDGSQIRIELTPDSIEFGSRRVEFNNRGIDSNFRIGMEKFIDNNLGKDLMTISSAKVHLFGEYFSKPKHNALEYDRIPKNHIMLFDVAIEDHDGRLEWCNNLEISQWAATCEIEAVPFHGFKKTSLEEIKQIVERESVLGGVKMEGVVIKARNRRYNTTLVSLEEHPFMLAKYVRPEFQEENKAANPGRGDKLQQLYSEYNSKARWRKAIYRLRDENVLEGKMSDMKNLIPEVQKDIGTEDKDQIKEKLWQLFSKELLRHSIKGFPEYYQEFLLDEDV